MNCVKRNVDKPFLLLTASYPVPYGTEFVGQYNIQDDMLINENPVYKYEFYQMYAIWYQQKLIFSKELDVVKDGWFLELRGDSFWVWNSEQKEFLYEDTFSLSDYDVIPEIETQNDGIPCKLQISSKGKLNQYFPDQFGVYKLISNFSVYNNPVWKHISKDFYLRVDNGGQWIVTSVSISYLI